MHPAGKELLAARQRSLHAFPEYQLSQDTQAAVDALADEIRLNLVVGPGLPLDRALMRSPGGMSITMLSPHRLAEGLLILANLEGIESATAWVGRISKKGSTPERTMVGIHALKLSEAIEIAGCSFIPVKQMKQSLAISKWMVRAQRSDQLSWPETVAFLDTTCPNIYSDHLDEDRIKSVHEWRSKLSVILNAIGYALDGSPSLGEMFHEYLDEDLEFLDHFGGYSWQHENAPRQLIPVTLTSAGVTAAERHLAATGQVRRQLDLAAERLALARRRAGDADRAIDISIALEALLGDTKKFDMTYKLSLRAARLLSDERNERIKIRNTVKEFYSLRSRIVHGQVPTLKRNEADTIKEVGRYCNSLALRIAENGINPDWDDVEL